MAAERQAVPDAEERLAWRGHEEMVAQAPMAVHGRLRVRARTALRGSLRDGPDRHG